VYESSGHKQSLKTDLEGHVATSAKRTCKCVFTDCSLAVVQKWWSYVEGTCSLDRLLEAIHANAGVPDSTFQSSLKYAFQLWADELLSSHGHLVDNVFAMLAGM
jgi:hypothetical protein